MTAIAGRPDTLVDLGALAPTVDPGAAVIGQFERLRAAAQAGVRRLVVVTGQGGALGHDGPAGDADGDVLASAAQGVIRTFARELADVEARLVDVDPAEDADIVAGHLLAELADGDARTEVGRTAGGRRTLATAVRPLDSDAGIEAGISEDRDLGAGSVVVVTGGARGIGARLAVELARATGCGIELIGRSPLPGPEPADLAGAADEIGVRKAVLARGEHTRPADVEAATARALADREIRATLADLAGSRRLRALPLARRARHRGPGRGARRDPPGPRPARRRRPRRRGPRGQAAPRQDRRVVRPGVRHQGRRRPGSSPTPSATTPASSLFFGSVSGVFGNPGQVDYAAANDALDGIARRARAASPGARVVAIDWGPWAGDRHGVARAGPRVRAPRGSA